MTSHAKAEAARRVLLRRRLMAYVKHYNPAYQDGWVHNLICRRLERFSDEVAQKLSPRLMFLMPPRHGKSMLVSQEFPGWHLGRNPLHEFISASYNISLPTGFSRKIRNRLRDATYRALFPDAVLDPDSQSAEQWLLIAGGGYLAAGVGGGITGKGAHVLSIDDPIKNAEEADSEITRESLWDWYGSTAYTRLAPGGGVLLTQTWWHDADLAGRLQSEMRDDPEFDQFDIIRFPAIADEDEWLTPGDTIWRPSDGVDKPDGSSLLRERGEALHSDRYDIAKLQRIKKTLTPRHFSALYQQNPVPDEGAFFKKDQFIPFEERPEGDVHFYTAWDLAAAEKTQNDWTVGFTIAHDSDDNIEVVDVVRFKGDSFKIVDAMIDAYVTHRPLEMGVEDSGQQWKAIKPLFVKRCMERKIYPVIRELKALTDKQARAKGLQGRMEMHKVRFRKDAPYFEKLFHEMVRFGSGGVHDDQVDAFAHVVNLMVDRPAPRKPVVKKAKSWKDSLHQLMPGISGSHMSA